MQSVEEAGTPSWACGGALSSGNIANSAEGSLPFRCDRILSITAVVRHSLFDASNDLTSKTLLFAKAGQRGLVGGEALVYWQALLGLGNLAARHGD